MKRREFILAGADVALPAVPALPSSANAMVDRAHLIQIIEQLEADQGWETVSVIAAKHFTAWQFRKALSLPLGDSQYPQMHIDFQRDSFGRYQRTVWAERDLQPQPTQQIINTRRRRRDPVGIQKSSL